MYVSSMQVSYLESIFSPHQLFMIFDMYLKTHIIINYFTILRSLSPFLLSVFVPKIMLSPLDPNHSFCVHLGRTKEQLKCMTLKISVKTRSQLAMACPAIPWTWREATGMTPSWQRTSGSPLSEGLLFCFPKTLSTCSLQLLSITRYQGQIIHLVSSSFFLKKFSMGMTMKGNPLHLWRPLEP